MIDELWNWLTNIPVAIWGSFITGAMTLAGVVVGQYAIRRRQERKAEKELEAVHDALAAELRTADEWLEQLLYVAHDLSKAQENAYALTEEQYEEAFKSDFNARLSIYRFTADNQQFSKDVFRSNANKLGEIDSEIAEAVIQTYNQIETLNKSLGNLKYAVSYEELASNSDVDWTTGAGLSSEVFMLKQQIESAVFPAILFQKMTLARLGDTGTESDRAAVAFAFSHMEAQSKEQEQFQQYLQKYMEKYDISTFEELVSDEGNHPMAQK